MKSTFIKFPFMLVFTVVLRLQVEYQIRNINDILNEHCLDINQEGSRKSMKSVKRGAGYKLIMKCT
jgi:hypothetical protein